MRALRARLARLQLAPEAQELLNAVEQGRPLPALPTTTPREHIALLLRPGTNTLGRDETLRALLTALARDGEPYAQALLLSNKYAEMAMRGALHPARTEHPERTWLEARVGAAWEHALPGEQDAIREALALMVPFLTSDAGPCMWPALAAARVEFSDPEVRRGGARPTGTRRMGKWRALAVLLGEVLGYPVKENTVRKIGREYIDQSEAAARALNLILDRIRLSDPE